MINTLTSEWIKLRSLLVHWVLVVVAVGFPLVITTLVAFFGDFELRIGSDEVSGLIVGLMVVSAMLFGTVSAISLTSEYSHNTIRPTYAATPARVRVVISKLVVNTVAGVVLAAVTAAACWTVAAIVLSGRDLSVSLSDEHVIAQLASGVALVVLVAWFAFGLGLVIRNAPATVTLALLWPLLIENLIGLLFLLIGWEGATRWLPYQAALSATANNGASDVDALGRPAGLLYFGAVAFAVIVFGTWLDRRRDA